MYYYKDCQSIEICNYTIIHIYLVINRKLTPHYLSVLNAS